MSELITLEVFSFDELDANGKARASDYYRENWMHHSWWDSTFEDFISVLDCYGFTPQFDTRTGSKGKKYDEPDIRFSGFWSQGDGASFTGNFLLGDTLNAGAKVRSYAPNDSTLHALASLVEKLGGELKEGLRNDKLFEALKGTSIHIRRSDHQYVHEYVMRVDSSSIYEDIAYELGDAYSDFSQAQCEAVNQFADGMLSAAQGLARWLYKALEEEYNHQVSSEQIAEGYAANGVRFHSDGRVFHA